MKLIGLVTLVLLLLPAAPAVAVDEAQCGVGFLCLGTVDAASNGWTLHVHEESPGTSPPAPSSPPVVQRFDYRPACGPDGVLVASGQCGLPASINCAFAPGEPTVVAVQRIAPDTSGWTILDGWQCLTREQMIPFDPAQLAGAVADYLRRVIVAVPAVHAAPADTAVVNLPELVWTDPPAQTSWTFQLPGLPAIHISGRVDWQVDFGDGSSLTVDWPGRGYDGTDPREHPEHYLAHTYTAPAAAVPMRITARWSASYTVDGFAASYPVPGAVERTGTLSLPVHEYQATLTGN